MITSLVRNANSRHLLEYFWTASVATIFGIRIFLYLTGYPQLGGSSFHIAHMLWGGLMMAGAIILMLSFLNRDIKRVGAILGGVGFGTFIDELGKFITHDNNYFFQPTILLLYLIFVALFFLAKQIEVWFPLDKHEYLINSLELIKEVAVQDLDAKEKQEALKYLRKASDDQELRAILIKTLNKIEPRPLKKDSYLLIVRNQAAKWYKLLVQNRLFAKVMIAVFVLASLDNFAVLFLSGPRSATFVEWGLAAATCISLIFIVQGAFFFNRRRRLAAFRSLKLATLVSIFLVQLFLFYIEQLSAAVELVGSLVSLQVLQLLIQQEKILALKNATHSKAGASSV